MTNTIPDVQVLSTSSRGSPMIAVVCNLMVQATKIKTHLLNTDPNKAVVRSLHVKASKAA